MRRLTTSATYFLLRRTLHMWRDLRARRLYMRGRLHALSLHARRRAGGFHVLRRLRTGDHRLRGLRAGCFHVYLRTPTRLPGTRIELMRHRRSTRVRVPTLRPTTLPTQLIHRIPTR